MESSGLKRATGKIFGALASLPEAAIKAEIRSKLEPYIDALEQEGFGREEWATMVAKGISFFTQIMPEEWKAQMVELAPSIEEVDNNTLVLFMEVLASIRPWFPQVVTRAYLYNELNSIKKWAAQAGGG